MRYRQLSDSGVSGGRGRFRALGLLWLFPFCAFAAVNQLVILNWSEYMDPAVIRAFEARYQVEVSEVYYSNDAHRTRMLLNNDGEGYDLILVSGVDLGIYARRGWLAELEPGRLPCLAQIDNRWRSAFPLAEHFGVPYFWGTTGIIYRRDLVPAPITSWKQLFQPAPALKGHIGMISDPRDLIGMGLKSLGYSANSSDPAELQQVETLLLAQQPYVRTYILPTLDDTSALLSGELWAALFYNGDAATLQQHSEALAFAYPEEGGNLWVDYLAVGAKATRPDLAYAFINFINEAQHAAALAQYLNYPSPNRLAAALLPEAFRQNPTIYPPAAFLEKSEFYQPDMPVEGSRMRNLIGAGLLY